MTRAELTLKLTELRSLPAETEVVEFKEAKNNFDINKLGKYFSALSNEANLKNKEEAWFIFGIENSHHAIVGSNFRSNRPDLDSLKGEVANKTTNGITFKEIYELILPEGRVVMFQIPPAPRGLPIAWEGQYYARNGEELAALNIEKFERIRNQPTQVDWSARICEDATIGDLDSNAILKARENFKVKNARIAPEVDTWNDVVFLNRAKITINGQITRAAIILLGKPESEHFISPGITQITWVLKDKNNVDKDYEHFTCPLILAVDKVFAKIRNLKYRYIKDGSLFPEEVDQYDPYSIKEALSNCIAHQDYTLGGRISITENDDGYLIFANCGNFLPGSIENVINNDGPPAYYRNKFLADAMVALNMIDTIGSGIRRMFDLQRAKFFPMPDFDLTGGMVKATLTGKVLDPEYALALAKNPTLSLMDIIMLDKLQKKKELTDEEISHLKELKLIEGRKPRFYISAKVAQTIGQKAEYTKHRAFNKQYYFDLIGKCIEEHGSITRQDIDKLLLDKLSDLYTKKQGKEKINNLISELRKSGKIKNEGSLRKPKWVFNKD